MSAWCTEHYWMTFFLALAAIQGLVWILRGYGSCKCKDDDE